MYFMFKHLGPILIFLKSSLHFMPQVGRPRSLDKICNNFLVIKRLKTITIKHSCINSLKHIQKH
jgi:hypothetical protein